MTALLPQIRTQKPPFTAYDSLCSILASSVPCSHRGAVRTKTGRRLAGPVNGCVDPGAGTFGESGDGADNGNLPPEI